jgi:hypothetical protein
MQARLFVSHAVAQTRLTTLNLAQAFPAAAAIHLQNLRRLHTDQTVSVSQVQALQRLTCLTTLIVTGLSAKSEDAVLQPSDLPPRLQVLGMDILSLYSLRSWLPALIAVG